MTIVVLSAVFLWALYRAFRTGKPGIYNHDETTDYWMRH